MLFINFKGWRQPLNEQQKAEFLADKGKYLATHKHFLSDELRSPNSAVDFANFRAGYIINERNELTIDIDNNKDAEKRIHTLLQHYKIDYRAQRTKKGAHIWLLIPQELVPQGKVKEKINGIELMYAGAWVFGGKDLDFYYLPFNKTQDLSAPLTQSPRAAEFFAELTTSANMPFVAINKHKGDRLTNYPQCAEFATECVENFFDADLFYDRFFEFFGYHLTQECNDVSPFTESRKPLPIQNRNNVLNRIRFELCRNVAMRSPQHIYSFLCLVNERVFIEPLPTDEIERSFSLKRIGRDNRTLNEFKGEVKASLTIDDQKQIKAEQATYEPTPYDVNSRYEKDLYLNIDTDLKKPAVYRYDEINGEVILSPVRNTADALQSEILREPILRPMFSYIHTAKNGNTTLKFRKPEKRIKINEYLSHKVGIPQVEIDTSTPRRADIIFNFAGCHFNRKINQPQIWSDDEFDKSTFARFARERIFECENHFTLFCHHLKQRMRGAPLTKAFLMLGAEGIGKDTFVEFLAHSLFRKYGGVDYRKTCQYKRSFSEFVDDKWAGRFKALILNLNEAGKNYVFGRRSIEELKQIIGNVSATAEEKGKDARTVEIPTLFCIISTNELAVDLSYSNNDRVYINYCPANDSLRNNPKLIKKWFNGLSIEEMAENEGGEFINYIYNTDRFDKAAAGLLQRNPTFALQGRDMGEDSEDAADGIIGRQIVNIERELQKIATLCETPSKLKDYLVARYNDKDEATSYTSIENVKFHTFTYTLLMRLGYDLGEIDNCFTNAAPIIKIDKSNYTMSDRIMPKIIGAMVHYYRQTRPQEIERNVKWYKQKFENEFGKIYRHILPPKRALTLGGEK